MKTHLLKQIKKEIFYKFHKLSDKETIVTFYINKKYNIDNDIVKYRTIIDKNEPKQFCKVLLNVLDKEGETYQELLKLIAHK